MNGFYNKVLIIDLRERTFQEESLDDSIYQEFLGGKGVVIPKKLWMKFLRYSKIGDEHFESRSGTILDEVLQDD